MHDAVIKIERRKEAYDPIRFFSQQESPKERGEKNAHKFHEKEKSYYTSGTALLFRGRKADQASFPIKEKVDVADGHHIRPLKEKRHRALSPGAFDIFG